MHDRLHNFCLNSDTQNECNKNVQTHKNSNTSIELIRNGTISRSRIGISLPLRQASICSTRSYKNEGCIAMSILDNLK